MNILINMNEGDFIIFFINKILISLLSKWSKLFNIHIIRFGIIQIKFGIKIKVKIDLVQLIWMFIIEVEGSKILNKFIIIFRFYVFIFNFNFF